MPPKLCKFILLSRGPPVLYRFSLYNSNCSVWVLDEASLIHNLFEWSKITIHIGSGVMHPAQPP